MASPGAGADTVFIAPAIYPVELAFGAGSIFFGVTTGTRTDVNTLLLARDLMESAALLVYGTSIPLAV